MIYLIFGCPPTGVTNRHDASKAEGYVIPAGQGDPAPTLFRISTLGQVNPARTSAGC
jgi:aspartate aminotransferase-like enzyme